MTRELSRNPPEPPSALSQPASGGARLARPALRVATERAAVDLEAAQQAAAAFLVALGIDLDREGLRATPARMARAYAELLTRSLFG